MIFYICIIYNFLKICKHVGNIERVYTNKDSYWIGVVNTFSLPQLSFFQISCNILFYIVIYKFSILLLLMGLHFPWSLPPSATKGLSGFTCQSVTNVPSPLNNNGTYLFEPQIGGIIAIFVPD